MPVSRLHPVKQRMHHPLANTVGVSDGKGDERLGRAAGVGAKVQYQAKGGSRAMTIKPGDCSCTPGL